MGNWNVNIQGVGIHDNGLEGDVEQMTNEFVKKLRAAGHSIQHAKVTIGGMHDVNVEEFEKFHPLRK